MTEQDNRNYEIIKGFTRHFSLDEKSSKIYKSILTDRIIENSFIDDKAVSFLGDDLRLRIPLNINPTGINDEGYKLFTQLFGRTREVSYSEFLENKIAIENQTFKLFKYTKKEFINDIKIFPKFLITSILRKMFRIAKIDFYDFSIEYNKLGGGRVFLIENVNIINSVIDKVFEAISQTKRPNRKLELVITRNFADWFLCSTAEKWSSCLSLESTYNSAFWAGLPGLAVDKNRLMYYITDGETKEYKGIVVDKILQRSWLLLDDCNFYNILNNYPQTLIDNSIVENELDKFIMTSGSDRYTTKHSIDLLYNKNESSIFIYQDNSTFIDTSDGIKITDDDSRYVYIFRDKLTTSIDCDEGVYDYNDGFTNLISSNTEIEKYNCCICHSCGDNTDGTCFSSGKVECPICKENRLLEVSA